MFSATQDFLFLIFYENSYELGDWLSYKLEIIKTEQSEFSDIVSFGHSQLGN
jgi:hypothetical protein